MRLLIDGQLVEAYPITEIRCINCGAPVNYSPCMYCGAEELERVFLYYRVPELDYSISSLDGGKAVLHRRGGKWILGWHPYGNVCYMGVHPTPREVEIEKGEV